MHKVIPIILNKHKHPKLYDYFLNQAELYKEVYNQALFVERQLYTASDQLKENQKEVLSNCEALGYKHSLYLSYTMLEKYMRKYHHECYETPLSSQCVQNAIKQASRDIDNFHKSLNAYDKHPTSFYSKPKLPNYCKTSKNYIITNQDSYLKEYVLKLPKTRLTMEVSYKPDDFDKLMQVEVQTYYDTFKISLVYKTKDTFQLTPNQNYLGIDLGVNHICAIVSKEESMLINGKMIKSKNQYFNKRKALLQSKLDQQYKDGKKHTSKQLEKISRQRTCWMYNYMHHVSKYIINYCLKHNITHIVIGKNNDWKQEVNIGKTNNQNFVSIPYNKLIQMLQYKGETVGIEIILVNEAYTSKASYVDEDDMTSNTTFSGKRISRGLYQTRDGTIINADINGAANILKKYDTSINIPVSSLQTVRVVNVA